MSTNTYIVKWKALYLQADIDNLHACELLEKNTAPGTIARLFQEGD